MDIPESYLGTKRSSGQEFLDATQRATCSLFNGRLLLSQPHYETEHSPKQLR